MLLYCIIIIHGVQTSVNYYNNIIYYISAGAKLNDIFYLFVFNSGTKYGRRKRNSINSALNSVSIARAE